MKKQLIAVAVAAAVAAPAMAQNISMYGIFGAGFTKTDNSGTTVDTFAFDAGTNSLATTVFGLRGTEDLGGGLRLSFQFEGAFDTGGRVGNGAFTSADNFLFNRHAFIGLQNEYGTIKLGRTADAIDSTEGFANFVQLFDTEAADENGIGNKSAGTIRYESPTFAGLSAVVTYTNDARTPTTTAASTFSDQKVSAWNINYVKGPLTLGYAEGQTGKSNSSTSASSTVNPKITTLFAGYKLGDADIRIQQTQENDSNRGKNKTAEASIRYELGGGLYAVGHYENFNVNDTDTTDYKQMGVFVGKALSKRTTVYAGYRSRDLDIATGTDVTTTVVGIQHSF